MLEVRNFSLWLTGDAASAQPDSEPEGKSLLRDISLAIGEGECLALAGESGSGKSVMALSILRLMEETCRSRHEGQILWRGEDIFTFSGRRLRSLRGNRIAMIFQEPMSALNPVFSIGRQLAEPLMLHRGLNRHEAGKEAARLLGRTGIDEPETRLASYPHQLSGGQRQRIIIAMALACQPDLLIADEPTTSLDVTIQEQILALLADLRREYRMAVLLISHDLTLVKKLAERVAIMRGGRLIEQGGINEIFQAPKEEYTRHLLSAIPKGQMQARQDGEALLWTRRLACHFPLPVTWKNWLKRQQFIALDETTLAFREGLTYGIVGESGSGKTTLAMAILRLAKSQGKVYYLGQPLHGLSAKALRPLRRQLQIVFQDPFASLSPRLTVGEIVAEGLRVHERQMDKEEIAQAVAASLAEVGLEPAMAHRYPHEFSGGQRQRIAIARAIILKPRLLILDEPTSSLDVTIQAQIIDLLKALQNRHRVTYLFISHDLRVVRSLADYLIVMRSGRIVEQGRADRIFARPGQPYTQRLLQAALGDGGQKIEDSEQID
ncbi:MAG: dipeptide ABC transporter ATP-binding protein [Desulfobulbaceae bacterium]|jgi:microcin C transport system ATP-binding protein|nr:dipeptide ABC transporter ATP-binding protein [Desulfobulbaceae bacterium]